MLHNWRMLRPCYLVVDREYSSGISTRKLVIETAKFNVITAYNGAEALETLRAFPMVSGAVLDDHLEDIPCPELASELKKIKSDLIVIAIGSPRRCQSIDHYVESFSPERLLELLRKLQPAATAAIEETNVALHSIEKSTE